MSSPSRVNKENPAIYVLEERGTDPFSGREWLRTTTYWPKKDGAPPQALLDKESLWSDWPNVTVTRHHFKLVPMPESVKEDA